MVITLKILKFILFQTEKLYKKTLSAHIQLHTQGAFRYSSYHYEEKI